jgi:hypothetical protein
MKAKDKFENGERVYVTGKCYSPVMNAGNELYYVGQTKKGSYVIETEGGNIVKDVPASWFRKPKDVTHYVNVYKNDLGEYHFGVAYRTPQAAEAFQFKEGNGYTFVKMTTVQLPE